MISTLLKRLSLLLLIPALCLAQPQPPGLDVQDEGTSQGFADVMDFVGAGVTATHSGVTSTITIPDTNTNADTICSGTTTYLDGEGNCDDISSVYAPASLASDTEMLFQNGSDIDGIPALTFDGADINLGETTDGILRIFGTPESARANYLLIGDGATGAQIFQDTSSNDLYFETIGEVDQFISNYRFNLSVKNNPLHPIAFTLTRDQTNSTGFSGLFQANVSETGTTATTPNYSLYGAALIWDTADTCGAACDPKNFYSSISIGEGGALPVATSYSARFSFDGSSAHTTDALFGFRAYQPFFITANNTVTNLYLSSSGDTYVDSIAAGTVTNLYKNYIWGGSFTHNITNEYGLTIEEQDEGSSRAWELWLQDAGAIQFRDAGISIGSSIDGQLDIDADTLIEIDAPTVAIPYLISCDTIDTDASGNLSCGTDGGGGSQNLFETIATTSGTNPVADSTTDTLTLTAGTGITVTGDSATDTVTIASTITDTDDQSLDEAYDNGNTIDVDGSAVTLTVSDTDNNEVAIFNQNDVTNNPEGVAINNAGTGVTLALRGTETTTSPNILEMYSADNGALEEAMNQVIFYAQGASAVKYDIGAITARGIGGVGVDATGNEMGLLSIDISAAGTLTPALQFQGNVTGATAYKKAILLSGLVFNTDVFSEAYYSLTNCQYAFRYDIGTFTGNFFSPNATTAGLRFDGSGACPGATVGINFISTGGTSDIIANFDVDNNRTRFKSGHLLGSLTAGGALNIGTVNTGAMTYGNVTNTTSQTFRSDGTGNAEIVLPNDSIGPAEIDDTTGAWNFNGVTSFQIPGGTNPTVSLAGQVAVDTTSPQLIFGSGAAVLDPEEIISAYSLTGGSGQDNNGLTSFVYPVTITGVVCRCITNCTTPATITLEDGAGNAMTMASAATCEATAGTAATPIAVTAAGALTAGELLRFDITNAHQANQRIAVSLTYTVDRQ